MTLEIAERQCLACQERSCSKLASMSWFENLSLFYQIGGWRNFHSRKFFQSMPALTLCHEEIASLRWRWTLMHTKVVIDSLHVIWEGRLNRHLQGQVLPQHVDHQELVRLERLFFHSLLDVLHRLLCSCIIPGQHLLPWLLVPLGLENHLSKHFVASERCHGWELHCLRLKDD